MMGYVSKEEVNKAIQQKDEQITMLSNEIKTKDNQLNDKDNTISTLTNQLKKKNSKASKNLTENTEATS